MASLQGLPPLPKSLSGLLNFSSAQWKEMERLHAMRTMIQQDINRSQHINTIYALNDQQHHHHHHQHHHHASSGASFNRITGGPVSASGMSNSEGGGGGGAALLRCSTPSKAGVGHQRIKASTLDAQLAVLRKEMVGLRQLDMSLLCQLWSLNESLLEYKHLLQDRLSMVHSISSSAWDNNGLGGSLISGEGRGGRVSSSNGGQSSCDEPDSPGPFGQLGQQHQQELERRRHPPLHHHHHHHHMRSLHMVQEHLSSSSSLSSSTSHSSLEFGDI